MIETIATILITLSVVVNLIGFFVVRHMAVRLIQFDNMFNNIIDDVEIFRSYMAELITKSTFSRSPDMISLNQNINQLKTRFDGYADAYAKKTKIVEKEAEKPLGPRPVGID